MLQEDHCITIHYYGAIESDGVVRYVKRIGFIMKENDVKNIVDDTVRGIMSGCYQMRRASERSYV